MRTKLTASIFAAALLLTSSYQSPAQSSLWLEGTSGGEYVQEWLDNSVLKATVHGSGTLQAVSPYGLIPATSEKGKITCSEFREGDCWLFKQPVDKLKKKTYIEFDFSFISHPYSPLYYIVEVKDGRKWHPAIEGVRRAEENRKVKYSFKGTCIGLGNAEEPKAVLQTFRLKHTVKDTLELRIRAVGPYIGRPNNPEGDKLSSTGFTADNNTSAYINVLGRKKPKDTRKVLCIGNSFTYFFGASFDLKELAWSMGHRIHMVDAFKGGQDFGQHLELIVTNDAVREGGFDHAFLQDQSKSNLRFGQDSVEWAHLRDNAVKLAQLIREYSPGCDIIHENTWRDKGTDFGQTVPYMRKGAEALAAAEGGRVSPIVEAFDLVSDMRPDIELYWSDGHHQSAYGAYLKACVNYLVLGLPRKNFEKKASDCHLDHETAAYLRSVALDVVK